MDIKNEIKNTPGQYDSLKDVSAAEQARDFQIRHQIAREGERLREGQLEVTFLNETFVLRPGSKKVFTDVPVHLRVKLLADGPGESLRISVDEMPFISVHTHGTRVLPVSLQEWRADLANPSVVGLINSDIEVSLSGSHNPNSLYGTLGVSLSGGVAQNLERVLGERIQGVDLVQIRTYKEDDTDKSYKVAV